MLSLFRLLNHNVLKTFSWQKLKSNSQNGFAMGMQGVFQVDSYPGMRNWIIDSDKNVHLD
jgi:hypothetical protein